MTEWQLKRDGNVERTPIELTLVQNANPFGDHLEFAISTADGAKAGNYQRGTSVSAEARKFNSGNSFTNRFSGYVVESGPRNEVGGDILDATVYGLNTLLRANTVTDSLADQTISTSLQQVVEDFTPVAWDASKVSVTNDRTIRRSFNDEKTDTVFQTLAQLSAGESFGVDNTGDFFFRPAQTSQADAIGENDWTDYNIPDRSKETVNEVRLFYDGGERVVTVDDSADKLSVQDSIGTASPVTFAKVAMREDITEQSEARTVAKRILSDRSPVRQLQVTTFGHLDDSPGDTVEITIPQAGIRAEYRIAQLEYHIDGSVTITAVRPEGERMKAESVHSDMLVRHSDTLERVEMRPAAQGDDVISDTRVVDTSAGGIISVGGSVDTEEFDAATLTNTGWTQFRDAYINASTLDITTVVVGTGDSTPTQTDSSLDSQSESLSASISTSGQQATISASPTTGDTITEVGLKLAGGEFIFRGTLTAGVDGPDSVDVVLEPDTDPEVDRAVVTTTGQEYARDILADNSPTHSDKIAVGDGTTDVTESDTTLANQLDSRAIGEDIVRRADSTDAWEGMTRLLTLDSLSGDPEPVEVSDGKLQLQQTAFAFDVSEDSTWTGSTISGSQYTGSEAVRLEGDAYDRFTVTATPGYGIESQDARLAIRSKDDSASDDDELQIRVDGSEVTTFKPSSTLEWETISLGTELRADQSVDITIDGGVGTTVSDTKVDVVALYDSRFYSPGSWDNDTGGSGDYLDDPALYPSSYDVELRDDPDAAEQGDIFKLTEATDSASVSSTWNDTSGNQAISIEGNTTSNSSTASATFSSTTLLVVTLTLSNFGSRTGDTPTSGHKGQTVDDVQVTASRGGITARGRRTLEFTTAIPPNVVNGDTLSELGILDTGTTTQTRHRFAGVLIDDDQLVDLQTTLSWRMGDSARAVNQANFLPSITNLSVVEDGDTDGQAYFSVGVVSTNTTQ